MDIEVKSSAFVEGEMMPRKYTGEGENVSPPLEWTGIPEEAQSIALICDDPDASRGPWVHWVLYDLPPNTTSLPERVPRERTLENGCKQGANDSRKIGYDGPYPPRGVHRYYFRIYALDAKLNLDPGATRAELDRAMKGRILAQGQLMGRYTR